MWPVSDRPLVLLAPMDGITDPPFRRFIKRVSPRTIVFSEFLSSTNVARKPALAKKLFTIYEDERPVVIQLYGKDPDHFRLAAVLAEQEGAAGIDVNMGCPAKKVVAHRHGSALMKEIDLACRIVEEIKKAVRVPVTVKTRLGWEDHRNLIPFARLLQDAGLDAITIHGRTYSQKFEGEADWEPIYALKEALQIPVFGNGDICRVETARAKLKNLDGVMVGRGAVADPWLLRAIGDAFDHRDPVHSYDFSQKLPYWKEFAAMSIGHYDSELHACRAFRKFLVRLLRDLGLGAEYRTPSVRVESLAQIHRMLDLYAQASTATPAAVH